MIKDMKKVRELGKLIFGGREFQAMGTAIAVS